MIFFAHRGKGHVIHMVVDGLIEFKGKQRTDIIESTGHHTNWNTLYVIRVAVVENKANVDETKQPAGASSLGHQCVPGQCCINASHFGNIVQLGSGVDISMELSSMGIESLKINIKLVADAIDEVKFLPIVRHRCV